MLITAGCSPKKLKLPLAHAKVSTAVLNNSNIWIFYSVKNNDTSAILNRNNSISSTNWLYNIDRRLQLKHIYKPLKKILIKRQKVSPHHVEGMKDYFSFADTIDKHNKFLEFKLKDIQYKLPTKKDSTVVAFKFYKSYFKFANHLFLYSQFDSVLDSKQTLKTLRFQFYYKDNLTYNDYIKIKIKLYKYPFLRALENRTDFYFN